MAETKAVWGIDIGQAGLKAVRLRYAEAAQQVLAVAFDYIPHPKILSQPDANPAELIAQALETFLSRNDVRGDLVALGVPGQTALARFIQLPPVESAKVGEIVKYEAKQQIPFALEDVIWDFQTLSVGMEESGFMIDAEVGLFAMKRDQVEHHLKPLIDAKVEVELIQIGPLALHNFLCYDQLGVRTDKEFEASDDYAIVLDMGADNTTLLVTNGAKIWIRNVPIGGNHFTRALTKEMKLTFAKAEHLKCNATKAPDPRAVFQALRPVFNDYVSEIQRSIGYFSSVSRDAKIKKVIGVGNGFKLAGLQKFLQQNLQYEVERVETLKALEGDKVLEAPLFQENLLSFVVPYGLGLQALKLTRIHTTLLPPEIAVARKIRRKKPWALATAASLLLGLSLSTVGYSYTANSVSTERFGPAEGKVKNLQTQISTFDGQYKQTEEKNKALIADGRQLVQNVDRREYWLEVYRAINECLPRDVGVQLDEEDIRKKNRLSIRTLTAKKYANLADWHTALNDVSKSYMLDQDKDSAPQGAGWVFTLDGEHYHEGASPEEKGIQYVRNTILKNFGAMEVQQSDNTAGPVPVRKLGISHATIVKSTPRIPMDFFPKGNHPELVKKSKKKIGGKVEATPLAADDDKIQIWRTTFTIEFAWRPTSPEQRPEQQAALPAGTPGAPGAAPLPAAAPIPGDPAAVPADPAAVPADPAAAGVNPAGAAPPAAPAPNP